MKRVSVETSAGELVLIKVQVEMNLVGKVYSYNLKNENVLGTGNLYQNELLSIILFAVLYTIPWIQNSIQNGFRGVGRQS